MQKFSAGPALAGLSELAEELDATCAVDEPCVAVARVTCDLCETEGAAHGCHGCDARFCSTCCARLHSDAIIEDHVITRLLPANARPDDAPAGAVFKISGEAPSADSRRMACLDVHTRLGQSMFALRGCVANARALDSRIADCSIAIARARCEAEDCARRDFEGMLSALSRRENHLMQHLQRLSQAKLGRLSDYLEELDLRAQRLSDFLAAMNDPATIDVISLRESSMQLERMLAPSIDTTLSDSLNDLLRVCKFDVDVDIGGALRCIHGISSGRGQIKESDDSHLPNASVKTSVSSSIATTVSNTSLPPVAATDSRIAPAAFGSPQSSSSVGARENTMSARDVNTPYVKTGTNGDRLILGGRPCTGPLMEQLLQTLRSHHNLTSIDVTSSALGDAGALALATASLSCSQLCVLGMSQNNIGHEGASAIADAVVQHHSVHSLFLSSNNIGPIGAVSIARILMASPSLTVLNLKSNRIGSEGAQSIAAALSRNNYLLSLDLWNNDIGERGAGAISEAMFINTTLQELDIGSNSIMDSGFLVVVNALGSSSLVKLLCRVNQIGLLGVQGLVSAIPKLHRLRELHLWGNDLTSSGDELLTEACAIMPALRILR